MAATLSLGDWFDRLGAAGLRAGVRERLLANALLLRLAVQGRLPADRVERLRLIGPLVCGSPQQQRDYARLVDEVARAGARGAADESVGGQGADEAVDSRRARVVWIWLTALVLALLFAVGWQTFDGKFFERESATPQEPAAPQAAPAASQPAFVAGDTSQIDNTPAPTFGLAASAMPQPMYVPQRPLQAALPTVPAWAAPLRWSLAALGGLVLVFLAWRNWQRRRPYLEATYTDRDPVEERLLRDAEQEVAPVGPGPAVLMPVTRALRQRMDGGRAVLDVRATIAATIRQGGVALRPVMRAAQEMPEYLALVERASSDDHQARYHEAVVQALQARGVVVELFFYAHSPQYGVWRLGRVAEAGGVRPVQDRVSFASLQVRFARHRLLVFGDARSALDPDTGEVQPWASAARHHFVQRAWFTPLPVANWARAEAWVAETAGLDFLLLPMEDAALTTLADWLGSGRARLVQHPQAPFRFPPLIKGQELDWAVRRVAPPEDVLAQLLHELRGYLGPKRMQWLAACAVFPALAWPLTLALGRKLIEDDGERAVGLAALGALPWFRQGRMPGWLRTELVKELTESAAAALRIELTRRLENALAHQGEVIVKVNKFSLKKWLRKGNGVARDVVLMRFLTPESASLISYQINPEIALLFRDFRHEWHCSFVVLLRRKYILNGIFSAIALLCVGLFYVGYRDNMRYVSEVDFKVEALRLALQSDQARLSSDVVALLPLLDQTRALVGQEGSPWAAGFGLDQGPKLADAAQQAYERMLQEALLPRLALRVEEQVAGSMNNADVQYDALKTAVMLHDPAHFQPDWIRAYLQADWAANLPREVTAEQRANLLAHLDALLARGAVTSPIKANDTLIAQARARLTPTPLANRVFNRLQRVRLGADILDFTAVRAGGPSTPLVFTRASGKPLTEGVPGFYTYEGYHKAFNGVVKDATAELAAEETWVLGVQDSARAATLKDPMAASRLVDDVRRIYLGEYTTRWSNFIDDLRMLPTDNLSKAVQMSKVLTAPDSPLKPLLREIVRHTTLTPSANPNASVIDQAEKRLTTSAEAKIKVLAPIVENASAVAVASQDSMEKTMVDDRFTALRLLVTSPDGTGPAPIDGTMALINDIYTQLKATETGVQGGNAPPPSDVPNRAKAEAGRLPPPMKALLQSLSVSVALGTPSATQANPSQAVKSKGTTFCQQAITGRYPFDRNSLTDANIDEFVRLFAPAGLFDLHISKNLLEFVDTTTKPWSFRKNSRSSGLDSASLMQFQRAAEIRDAFFRLGNTYPLVTLKFKPLEMDVSITQFLLDVDGQTVEYAHGPGIQSTLQWPGPRGNAQARVALMPTGTTGSSVLVTEGSWALFRLFDRLQITSGNGPGQFITTFNLGGRKAVFEVTSSSVQNPLRLAALRSFACPAGF